MARVTINVYTSLREKLGWKTKVVIVNDDATLEDVVKSVQDLWNALREFIERGWTPMILVNGVHADLKGGMRVRVKDGDVIDVFPAAGGG